MARVAMIPPDSSDSAVRKVYRPRAQAVGPDQQLLAGAGPSAGAALMGWALPNDAIRLGNVKADPDYVKIQQLVIIKTSALNRSAYCMSHNVPLGKKVGLTEAQIKAAQGKDYMSVTRSRRPAESRRALGRGGDEHDGARRRRRLSPP